MNIVFFDPVISGHHTEYIEHISRYFYFEKENNFFFIVHPEFVKRCKHIVDKLCQNKNVSILLVSMLEFKKIDKTSVFLSFNYFHLLNKYSISLNADIVYILYFDIFQLALCFKRPKYFINGILFSSPTRLVSENWRSKLKVGLKRFVLRNVIKKKCIYNVFVLNDKESTSKLNNILNTDKFRYIPDPVPVIEPEKDFDIYNKYNIEKERLIFLHFGSLGGGRKGTDEILDSIRLIPRSIRNRICILILSSSMGEYETYIQNKVRQIVSEFADIQLIFQIGFIKNSIMKSIFMQSYCFLLPYKNTDLSSGLLGHAMALNKIIISPNRGIIGSMLKDYLKKNIIFDVSPLEIAKGIELCFKHEFTDDVSFVNSNTPHEFVSVICSSYESIISIINYYD